MPLVNVRVIEGVFTPEQKREMIRQLTETRFHNLRANPSVTVELGRQSYQARAVIAEGADRDRLYGLIAAQVPAVAEYEKSTDRTFPVVVLEGVPVPA